MSYVLLPRLIAELPELGGWPEWAHECVLHTGSRKAMFYDEDGRFSHQPKFPKIEFEKASDVAISVSREEYEAALAASKPEWDGDGLPPVGCKCEWQDKNTKAWIPVVIAYSSEWVTVVRELNPLRTGDAVECCINNFGEEDRLLFRPTKSCRSDNELVDGYDVHHWSALAKERFHQFNALETEIIEVRRMLTGFYKDLKSGMKLYKIVTDDDE